MNRERRERLEAALGLLESSLRDAGDQTADPTVYTARYLKAMVHHDLDQLTAARAEAKRLVDLIARAREEAKKRRAAAGSLPFRRRRREREAAAAESLRAYLDAIHDPALIILGTLEIVTGEPAGAGTGLDRFGHVDRHSPLPLVQYNLACAHSLLGDCRTDYAERREQGYAALLHLGRALTLHPGYAGWARTDSALKFLRTEPSTKARFGQLTGTEPADAAAGDGGARGLAGIALIGAERAAALAELGIESEDDLLEKASTPAERARIATALGVPKALVLRWTDLADLTRVAGIETPEANLLQLAGVGSVSELAAGSPPGLAAMLAAVAPLSGAEAPTPGAVESWVRQARELPQVVACLVVPAHGDRRTGAPLTADTPMVQARLALNGLG